MIFVAVVLLANAVCVSQALTHYIIPTSNNACPIQNVQCITLSQYVLNSNTSEYNSTNTTLTLVPGVHILDREFAISGHVEINLVADFGSSLNDSWIIQCSNVGHFMFKDITSVSMRSITVVGCENNSFMTIGEFTLETSTFLGHNTSATGLLIQHVDRMRIIACNFTSNNGREEQTREKTATVSRLLTIKAGGVLTAKDSKIIIENSRFENNSVSRPAVDVNKSLAVGGVIYLEGGRCEFYSCMFTNNTTDDWGGVIYSSNGAIIKLYDSIAIGNFADTGGFAVIYSSMIFINNCVFVSNIANTSCGVLSANTWCSVSINNSTFTDNQAYLRAGVIGAEHFSAVHLNSSTFYRNKVLPKSKPYPPVNKVINFQYSGGVLAISTNSSVKIEQCTFSSNLARFFGGVIAAAYYLNVQINSSSFYDNLAGYYGGVLVIQSSSKVDIYDSVFVSNRAECSGGVIFASIDANVTIYDSRFANNKAGKVMYDALIGSGGVLLAHHISTVILERNIFSNNTSVNGGAMCSFINTTIIVKNCSFINNSAEDGGGVGAFEKNNVTITSSLFQFNFANRSGGVMYLNISTLAIYHSEFSSNRARVNGGCLYVQSSEVTMENSTVLNSIANFGGGIHCHNEPRQHNSANIELRDMNFLYNRVCGIGGVIMLSSCNLISRGYLHLQHNHGIGVLYAMQSVVRISGGSNTIVSNNMGSVVAFASSITFNGTILMSYNTPYYDKCNHVNVDERYEEGGAVTAIKSEVVFHGDLTLISNQGDLGGAVLAIQSKLQTISGTTIISNNTASISGGGVYAYQSEITLSGHNHVSDNFAIQNGGGFHAIGSTIRFSNGKHYVSGNSAGDKGGGMYLELDSKVYIVKDTRESYNCSIERIEGEPCIENKTEWITLGFVNNTASYGGAICVNDATNSDICSSISNRSTNKPSVVHSPTHECFFQTLSMYWNSLPTPHINANNTYFIDNGASVAGQTLYGGLLDRCTFNTFTERYTNDSGLSSIAYLQNVTNVDVNSIHSEAVRVCFCTPNGEPNCSYIPLTLFVKKGQTFIVSVVAVDQVNHTLPSTIHASLSTQSGGLSEGETSQYTTENCTDLKYTIFTPKDSEQIHLYADGPCKDLGISKRLIDIRFLPCDYCPIGFKTGDTSCVCDCDPVLEPYIKKCFNTNSSLLRRGEFWLDYVTLNQSNRSGYLIYPHCPFDYCHTPSQSVYIDLSIPHGADTQCSFNRSNKLCGQCKSGLSLSLGSNHCRTCSNYWLLLLVPFSLAGIALVTLVLVLNLTVAVGTINGLVFYANIVATNSNIFMPFEKPNFLTLFISWLNLDFGFETCFYNGMDAYVKTWLQFLFPLYIIFLVAAIIVISDYSPRFANLFAGKNPVATLATLILLSYAKLLRTIIAALSFAQLDYPDGSHRLVWLLDANRPYLTGKHIPLFIVAVITALAGLIYTIVLFSWQWFIVCSKRVVLLEWMTNTKLLAFIDAYHAPYNKQHRYWNGLLFLIRMILYLVFAVNVLGDPRTNLLSIICTTSILLFIQNVLLQRPYKTYALDILESLFIVNLTLYAAGTYYFRDTNNNQAVLAYISIVTTLLMFKVIVVYHAYKFTFRNTDRLKTQCKKWYNFCKCYQTDDSRIDRELQNVTELDQRAQNVLADDTVHLFNELPSCTEIDVKLCIAEVTNITTVSNNTHTCEATCTYEDDLYSSSDETTPLLDNYQDS